MEKYAEALHQKRKRKGITHDSALKLLQRANYFASMMVEVGDADALIGGINSQ